MKKVSQSKKIKRHPPYDFFDTNMISARNCLYKRSSKNSKKVFCYWSRFFRK